jgi:tRNA A37 methylthiotransferase MiaB
MREKTHAHRRLADDVTEDVKLKRLARMNEVFLANQGVKTEQEKGRLHLVLLDGQGRYEG